MTRKTGVAFLVAANVLLLYTSLAARAYARLHTQLGATILAACAASWPVAMACALAFNGLELALIPIRHGERWAIWLSAVTLFVLLATRGH